jgi:hypothetical protein
VLLDGRGVLVEEAVEDEGGLAQLAVDDVDPVLRPLIADVADDGDAPSPSEGTREVAGVQRRRRHPEADPVRGRRRAGAEGLGQRQAAVVVDEGGDGGAQGVLPQVPVDDPRELAHGDTGRARHGGQADVGGLSDQHCEERRPDRCLVVR